MTFEEKQALAHNPAIPQFLRFLNECKTQLPSIIGEDQFKTLINAVTFEKEADLVFRFSEALRLIKEHKINE